MRRILTASVLLALLGIHASAWLQRPTFRSRTDLVVLSVAVTDKSGAFVPALPKDAFTVRQDGRSQPITQFREGSAPVRVVMAVDASHSMQGRRIEMARLAVLKFIDRLGPDDQLRVIGFNDNVFPVTDWTADRAVVAQAMARMQPLGATALYDAVVAGVEELRADDERRQALVIVSDGNDVVRVSTPLGGDELTGGRVAPERERRAMEGVDLLRLSDTLAYAIATGGASERPDTVSLKRFTDPTGGYTRNVSTPAEATAGVEQIAKELRAQYVIGFDPAGKPDGKFHKVDVSVTGCACIARTRNGFVAVK